MSAGQIGSQAVERSANIVVAAAVAMAMAGILAIGFAAGLSLRENAAAAKSPPISTASDKKSPGLDLDSAMLGAMAADAMH